jgi:hypothetical protein
MPPERAAEIARQNDEAPMAGQPYLNNRIG